MRLHHALEDHVLPAAGDLLRLQDERLRTLQVHMYAANLEPVPPRVLPVDVVALGGWRERPVFVEPQPWAGRLGAARGQVVDGGGQLLAEAAEMVRGGLQSFQLNAVFDVRAVGR